jgi:hypothetical protein
MIHVRSPRREHGRPVAQQCRPWRNSAAKSRSNFFYHTTTLLLRLSIRKPTELMPKNPVLSLRDMIRRTVTLKFKTNSSETIPLTPL